MSEIRKMGALVECISVDGMEKYLKLGGKYRVETPVGAGNLFKYRSPGGALTTAYSWRFKLVEEENKVADLRELIKPCMVVKLRNGELCYVVERKNGVMLYRPAAPHGGMVMEDYSEELALRSSFTKKDYTIDTIFGFAELSNSAYSVGTAGRPIVWERKAAVVELTLEEVMKELAKARGVDTAQIRIKE